MGMGIKKCYSLIRTNPLLSANIKIVIDSEMKIYLESFNANKILKKQDYKHYRIRNSEYYKEAVAFYFKNLESNTVFDPLDNDDKDVTYTDYSFQYDDTYIKGASFVEDNFYKEEYEYFAPLYINKNNIPSEFLIFRIDNTGILEDNIENIKFVSSFDLKDSKLGIWIDDNFNKDEDFPKYPLDIKHTDLSKISGLDIVSGGWVEKMINLNEFISNNTPIFKTEEYITSLWKNNNIIYPNILNFKFLFDDTPSTPDNYRKYTINRYTGFYADEKINETNFSSFKSYDLNVTSLDNIENLSEYEVSKIPYILNNMFVKEIDNRIYSFDPIKNGWSDDETYYIEYLSVYYRLKRIANNTNNYNTNNIIGDYLYIIVSDTNIIRCGTDINLDIVDTEDDYSEIKYRVLINDLGNVYTINNTTYSTFRNKITIKDKTDFNDFISYNLISYLYDNFIRFKRLYKTVTVNNEKKVLFKLIVDVNNNYNFELDDFEKTTIHTINIDNKKHIIKKYPSDNIYVPNRYYINTDYAINIDETKIEYWKAGKDSEFYVYKELKEPIYYSVDKYSLTDIKDFDFDRVDTKYSKFEYENNYEITESLEPKLYAKLYNEKEITINKLLSDKTRRVAITDFNNRPLYYRDNRNEYNIVTNETYKDTDLFYQDKSGNFVLFQGLADNITWYKYISETISINTDYYREEDYIWLLKDESDNIIGKIDFTENSQTELYETVTYGADNKNLISDTKSPLPSLKIKNPNVYFDPNIIPVSSEYIASNELWEIDNNNLTKIWDKNQTVCKWGATDSIGRNDYPYRLNYCLNNGIYNNEPMRFANNLLPNRQYLNLDYFYRFGKISDTNIDTDTYYSLNIDDTYFDIDTYIKGEYDYFEYLLENKYSSFVKNTNYEYPYTIFKGCKFYLSNIKERIFVTDNIIDDLVLDIADYEGYKFAIIFGRKLSIFEHNHGNDNNNQGIDIYLNEKYKNVLIHIYIESDNIININGQNIETCKIDRWYDDTQSNENLNTSNWFNTGFTYSDNLLDIRPRDFILYRIINNISDYNYSPSGSFNRVKFIKIDNDSYTINDYLTTDFILKYEEPTEILTDENGFITKPLESPSIEVFNSLDNRIIRNDTNNDVIYDSNNNLIGSINDINAYNNYPICFSIIQNDKKYWDLTDDDPSIFRYESYYSPIFKTIPIFESFKINKIQGNWKINNINVSLDEYIYSKCNETSSILKLQSDTAAIYPMIDEYGYDYSSRYLFKSTWADNYYIKSRLIDYKPNEKITEAGYTIHLDGYDQYLKIEDCDKLNMFNYIAEQANYMNNIDFDSDTIGYMNLTLKGLSSNIGSNSKRILIPLMYDKYYSYTISFKCTNKYSTNNTTPENIRLRTSMNVYNPNKEEYLSFKTSYEFVGNYSFGFKTDAYNNNPSSPSLSLDNYPDYVKYPVIFTELLIDVISSNNYMINDYEITLTPQIATGDDKYFTKATFNKTFNVDYLGFYNKIFDNKNIEEKDYVVYNKDNTTMYDTTQLNSLFPNWKSYAGIETPTSGRINTTPYDIVNYPIPEIWSGDAYINFLNNYKSGMGNYLKTEITRSGNELYDYDPNVAYSFDKACLYHYLEYGSQDGDYMVYNSYTTINVGYQLLNNFYSINYLRIMNNFSNLLYYDNVSSSEIFNAEYTTKCNEPIALASYSYAETSLTYKSYMIRWYNNSNETFKVNILWDNTSYEVIVPVVDVYVSNIQKLSTDINTLLSNNNIPLTCTVATYAPILIIKSNYYGEYYDYSLELLSNKDFEILQIINNKTINKNSNIISKTLNNPNRKNGRLNSQTIEFWFSPDNWALPNETIIYKGSDTTENIWDNNFTNMTYAIGRDFNSDKLVFKTVHKDLYNNLYSNIQTSSMLLEKEKWYHIACVIDSENCCKKIFINGVLDSKIDDFIITKSKIDERTMMYHFLMNRSIYFQGETHPNIPSEQNLAIKINENSTDNDVVYWYNVISGKTEPTIFDNIWQKINYPISLTDMFKIFKEKYFSQYYFLNTSTDNSYDILIGNTSTTVYNKYNWAGSIDELRIWNYARSNEDIRDNYRMIINYKEYNNILKTLIVYYRFDQGYEDNKINDLTNNYVYNIFEKFNVSSTNYYLISSLTGEYRKNKSNEYLHFGISLYPDSHIILNDNIDWTISEADIININNAKYQVDKAPFEKQIINTTTKYSKKILEKKQMNKISINTKKVIFDNSKNTLFDNKKWWKFKNINDIKKANNYTSKLVIPIVGNMFNIINNLIKKK